MHQKRKYSSLWMSHIFVKHLIFCSFIFIHEICKIECTWKLMVLHYTIMLQVQHCHLLWDNKISKQHAKIQLLNTNEYSYYNICLNISNNNYITSLCNIVLTCTMKCKIHIINLTNTIWSPPFHDLSMLLSNDWRVILFKCSYISYGHCCREK